MLFLSHYCSWFFQNNFLHVVVLFQFLFLRVLSQNSYFHPDYSYNFDSLDWSLTRKDKWLYPIYFRTKAAGVVCSYKALQYMKYALTGWRISVIIFFPLHVSLDFYVRRMPGFIKVVTQHKKTSLIFLPCTLCIFD